MKVNGVVVKKHKVVAEFKSNHSVCKWFKIIILHDSDNKRNGIGELVPSKQVNTVATKR